MGVEQPLGVEQPDERTLELREEELVVQRKMRDVGEAHIRTRVEEVPARLEVEANAEEVEVEHVPVGRVVSQRVEPYQDGDVLVVPIYEEQVVVTKRLLLREELRVRRVVTTQRQLVEDTLKKERVEVEDPTGTGLVHERYPAEDTDEHGHEGGHEGGLMDRVRRALQ
jgi:uncharacterized protein (TIGR02271 family)